MARISVVMATYRGTRFLPEQFRAISEQVRLPDEMVICDDGSGDGTLELVYEFAMSAASPVLVTRNAVRSGSNQAFGHALGLARGELIALADQDDVWKPGKLAQLEQALEAHPDAALAFCDVELVDEAGRRLPDVSRGPRDSGPACDDAGPAARDVLLRRRQAWGMSTLFRRRLLDVALPLTHGGGPEQGQILPPFIHDHWINLIAAACGGVVHVAEPLVQHRRHAGQQSWVARSGPLPGRLAAIVRRSMTSASTAVARPPESSHEARLAGAPRLEDLRARLLALNSPALTAPAMTLVRERLELIHTRSTLSVARRKRIRPVWHLLRTGVYRRHSRGVLSALADTFR